MTLPTEALLPGVPSLLKSRPSLIAWQGSGSRSDLSPTDRPSLLKNRPEWQHADVQWHYLLLTGAMLLP